MEKSVGIAGAAFNSKSVVNISYKGDSAGGYKRSSAGAVLEPQAKNVLCAPVISEDGRAIGTQLASSLPRCTN